MTPHGTSLSGPKDYKTFSCSTQLSMKFILLINVKKPVGYQHLIILKQEIRCDALCPS